MSTLTLVAKVTAKTGKEAELEEALRALIAPTRDEEGCLRYDLHLSDEVAGIFVFLEDWQTRELWERHMVSPHIESFKVRSEELVADWQLDQFTRIA